MQQFTIALVRVTHSGYITIYINGISHLTFLIIRNVLYLEYKPQNDAGTLLNKRRSIDVTGFHQRKKKKIKKKRLCGLDCKYDVVSHQYHKELDWSLTC